MKINIGYGLRDGSNKCISIDVDENLHLYEIREAVQEAILDDIGLTRTYWEVEE